MEVIFGVPLGVNLGVIYGVTENLCTASLEAVGQTTSLGINIDEMYKVHEQKEDTGSNTFISRVSIF